MKIDVIKVESGIEYISEVPAIIRQYKNDFPPNTVINKQVTGVGGSSLVLTNDVPYVLAVHLIDMIKCKVGQPDIYPNVLGVYGGVTTYDIQEYVRNGGKKIMVTYDSLPKVKEALGSKAKDFKLMVDEFHKLIAYLGDFKPHVAIKLLENSNGFKSVSYLTATPTNYKYLPEPMKKLDILEFDWEGKAKPDLKHCYVKNNMIDTVLATCLDKLDNTTDELYIFYNSKASITTLIKKLMMCKPELSLEKDFNVLFAKSDNNTKYFKKHLGKKFRYGDVPDGENNKRINFISSMGFEGIDFYPNHITNALPTSIVVSDPNSKSMQYDISIDLVQILGRHRKHKITGKRVHNEVIYFWGTQQVIYQMTEDDFHSIITEDRNGGIKIVNDAKDNPYGTKLIKRGLLLVNDPYMFLDEDGNIMIHPYSIEAQMSSFSAMHSDSYILNNFDDDGKLKENSNIISKLTDLNPNTSTYQVPMLNSSYVKLLGRKTSIKKLASEYEDLLKELKMNQNNKEVYEMVEKEIEELLMLNVSFKEWIESGITPSMMNTLKYTKSKLDKRSFELRMIGEKGDVFKKLLKLEVGKVYLADELVERLKQVYLNFGASPDVIKGSYVSEWYKIKVSSKRIDGKVVSGYKIVSEI